MYPQNVYPKAEPRMRLVMAVYIELALVEDAWRPSVERSSRGTLCLPVGAHVLGVKGEALVLFCCGGGSHGSSLNIFPSVGSGVGCNPEVQIS